MRNFLHELYVAHRLERPGLPSPELELFYAGSQRCPPGHSHHCVRDHYLFHYVSCGRGTYRVAGREFPVRAEEGFVVFPDVEASYRADRREPWTYRWIGFHGTMASRHVAALGVTIDNPVFSCPADAGADDCLAELEQVARRQPIPEFRSKSLVYRLFDLLAEHNHGEQSTGAPGYVYGAIQFIQRNYPMAITMQDVAQAVGLDRKYLSAIFKAATGKTPKEYLTTVRLNSAAGLLDAGSPVAVAAHSVGYSDEFYFSRAFRNRFGVPPSKFTRQGARLQER